MKEAGPASWMWKARGRREVVLGCPEWREVKGDRERDEVTRARERRH